MIKSTPCNKADYEQLYKKLLLKFQHLQDIYSSTGKDIGRKSVFLLGSKNVQLSREVNDLRREIQGKEAFIGGVDEDLYKIRDILKRILALLNTDKKEEAIKELKLTSQYVEALQRQMNRKIKSFKDLRERDTSADFEFMSEFIITPKESKKVTLADICSGEITHLNLKHVSRLELQLQDLYDCIFLYKEIGLLELGNSVDACLIPNLDQRISEHQKEIIQKSKVELRQSIDSLNSLSVLVPAAPYPKLERIRSVGYPSIPSKEEMISRLPSSSATFKAKFGEFWDQMRHGLNSYIDHKDSEVVALKKELDFHKSVYKQYNDKIGNVVEGLEKKRNLLDSDLEDVIGPLEEIRKNISALEFHPVKVGEFLGSTDDALANVLKKLHKNNL